MGAFLGISLWVALATAIPGFVTMAVVYAAFAIADPEILTTAEGQQLTPIRKYFLVG